MSLEFQKSQRQLTSWRLVPLVITYFHVGFQCCLQVPPTLYITSCYDLNHWVTYQVHRASYEFWQLPQLDANLYNVEQTQQCELQARLTNYKLPHGIKTHQQLVAIQYLKSANGSSLVLHELVFKKGGNIHIYIHVCRDRTCSATTTTKVHIISRPCAPCKICPNIVLSCFEI